MKGSLGKYIAGMARKQNQGPHNKELVLTAASAHALLCWASNCKAYMAKSSLGLAVLSAKSFHAAKQVSCRCAGHSRSFGPFTPLAPGDLSADSVATKLFAWQWTTKGAPNASALCFALSRSIPVARARLTAHQAPAKNSSMHTWQEPPRWIALNNFGASAN